MCWKQVEDRHLVRSSPRCSAPHNLSALQRAYMWAESGNAAACRARSESVFSRVLCEKNFVNIVNLSWPEGLMRAEPLNGWLKKYVSSIIHDLHESSLSLIHLLAMIRPGIHFDSYSAPTIYIDK